MISSAEASWSIGVLDTPQYQTASVVRLLRDAIMLDPSLSKLVEMVV